MADLIKQSERATIQCEGTVLFVADQLEEDEGEDAGDEAHERNPHDDFEDVLLVEGLVL